jgi:tetratricopeptide (TPR) repeat protein
VLSVLPSRSAADACASARDFLQRSQAALGSGDHAAGLEHAEQALQHAAPDGSERAEALTQQSTHQWRLGRFEDAVDSGRSALALWARLANDDQRCALLCHLAVAYSELGLHEEALRHATESFDCARVHGLRGREVQALNRIGICFERLGDPAQGERFLLQSLGEARDMHDDDDTLVALNNLVATTVGACHLYKQRGEHDASRQAIERGRSYATQAVALARRLGDAYRQTVIEGNLGEVLGLLGEHGRALGLMHEVARRADEHGYRSVSLRNRCNIAEMMLAQGRAADAVAELLPVLDALRQRDHEATRMRVHSALHRAYKALGKFEPALAHCEAHHAMELQRAALQNQAQARLMINRVEVEHQLALAERARQVSQ